VGVQSQKFIKIRLQNESYIDANDTIFIFSSRSKIMNPFHSSLVILLICMMLHVVIMEAFHSPRLNLQISNGQRKELKSIESIRGGAIKRRLSWGTMFKSFWLTLVDPSNVESLEKENKGGSSLPNKKSGFFGSKKSKGKSLH
jgi:hypothetical protein